MNSDLEITKSGKDPEGELLSFKNNKFDNLQSITSYLGKKRTLYNFTNINRRKDFVKSYMCQRNYFSHPPIQKLFLQLLLDYFQGHILECI